MTQTTLYEKAIDAATGMLDEAADIPRGANNQYRQELITEAQVWATIAHAAASRLIGEVLREGEWYG